MSVVTGQRADSPRCPTYQAPTITFTTAMDAIARNGASRTIERRWNRVSDHSAAIQLPRSYANLTGGSGGGAVTRDSDTAAFRPRRPPWRRTRNTATTPPNNTNAIAIHNRRFSNTGVLSGISSVFFSATLQ